MTRKLLSYGSFLFLFVLALSAHGQANFILEADPSVASFFAGKIETKNLKQHIEKLTSDEFGGRETGSDGIDRAADYLQSKWREWGIGYSPGTNSYEQNVRFTWSKWEELIFDVNGKTYEHMKDFISLPSQNINAPDLHIIEDIIFLGYGIDAEKYSDYRHANVKGDVVMIYPGEPFDRDSLSYLSGTKESTAWSSDFELKVAAASRAGVETLLVVDPAIRQRISDNRNAVRQTLTYSDPQDEIQMPNVIYISTDIAENIIGRRKKSFIRHRTRITKTGTGRPLHLRCTASIKQELSGTSLYGKNLIGYIEGTDPNLRDEVVVISAHYDHLGTRGSSIYPGADDNGSGTAAVMEIMRVVRAAQKEGEGPKRSVLGILFTAEEKGLLGSKYFSENPTVPLQKIVADINVDMIGRVDEKHAQDPKYIYVIGADRLSSTLHHINESTNETYSRLEFDYTYNEPDDPNRFYYRSDHYNFAKHGIPSIFFFSGVHKDYHQPGDTADKIMYPKYMVVTNQIFHTLWEVANRKERLMVDVQDDTIYDR